jgi:CRP-like cAMP-binding protein
MPGDATVAVNPLLAAIERRIQLSAEERSAVASLPMRMRDFSRGDTLVKEWSRPGESFVLLEGFSARIRTFRDGQSQILAVQVPGDFVDLHGFVLKRLDHSVAALCTGRGGFVPHEALTRMTDALPRLTRALWTMAEVDAAMQRNWNAYLGRRSALKRLASLLCELYVRLEIVDRVEGLSFSLPLSQAELADLLGLSVVHTNRILQELRGTGMVEWQKQTVTIRDWDGLQSLAEFDPVYLALEEDVR